ncbi:hypothetical protein MWH28_02880 [Natroniella sulfidigena]|uniref:hypothetical protein n=1 Tax=Natroniella sulfidigena TaxID=723921 RepID=UPI00200ABAC9|nr:hypothetical protein [Natroniella sulfidigena]MCK8816307.1 hypothetical protein [Natroniella sulfidigena]
MYKLDDILEKLDLEVINKTKVSKASYILETKEEKFLLKYVAPKKGILQTISRFFIGNSLSFKSEVMTYKELIKNKFKYFNYPSLLETDPESYILTQYISNSSYISDISDISSDNLILSLLEFQTFDLQLNYSFLENKMVNLTRKPSWKIIQFGLFKTESQFNLFTILKMIYVVLMCNLLQDKNKDYLLIHNDLFGSNFFSNNMFECKDKIYYCDFESIVKEKKWFLIDIIDLALDIEEKIKINADLIAKYLFELKKNKIINVPLQLKCQIRIALLRRIIQIIASKKQDPEQIKIATDFLNNILLNERKYNNWFKKEIYESVSK